MRALPAFIARYEVKQRLGQGGMGAIYLARDPVINRLVALKLLHSDIASEDLRRRFAQEAQASGALTHPNIVTIYDFGEFEEAPFIVMEYVRGATLAEVIKRAAPVPIVQKLRWIEQVCSALGYAHQSNIIHRDVKPSNLMVDQYGTIKVLDFGIARIVGAGLTKMSMVIGTPGYMSPEQIQGGLIDARSDIFAVGAVLYELLCYREAFGGDTPPAIMHRVINGQPTPLRELLEGADLSIADVVDKALEKDPDRRYRDMASLEADLRIARSRLEQLGSELTVVLPGRRQSSPPKTPRRRTDPVEIARRRAEQIEQHLAAARKALSAGDYDVAATECEEVLLLDPSSAAALALVEQIRAEHPTHFETLIGEARGAIASEDLEAAERLLAQATRLEPNSLDVRDLRAALQDRRDDLVRREQRRHDADGAYRVAKRRFDEGNIEAAQRFLSEALELDPAHAPSLELSERIREWLAQTPAQFETVVDSDEQPAPLSRNRTKWLAIAASIVVVVAIGSWGIAQRSYPTASDGDGNVEKGTLPIPDLPEKRSSTSPDGKAPDGSANPAGATAVPTPTGPAPDPPSVASKAPLAPEANRTNARSEPLKVNPSVAAPAADASGPLRLAEEAENAGDLKKALAQYDEALRIDRRSGVASLGRTKILAELRNRADRLTRRAESLFEVGDYDAAIRDLDAALAADSQYQKASDLRRKVLAAKAAESRRRSPSL